MASKAEKRNSNPAIREMTAHLGFFFFHFMPFFVLRHMTCSPLECAKTTDVRLNTECLSGAKNVNGGVHGAGAGMYRQ